MKKICTLLAATVSVVTLAQNTISPEGVFIPDQVYQGDFVSVDVPGGDGIENDSFPAAGNEISREGMAKGLFQSRKTCRERG